MATFTFPFFISAKRDTNAVQNSFGDARIQQFLAESVKRNFWKASKKILTGKILVRGWQSKRHRLDSLNPIRNLIP